MASLCELDIVALTDHNSCANCPAFFEAAKRYGIIPVAGMELTTSEDIHAVCLFERLEDAMAFGDEIQKRRLLIKNREDIFGEQLILDENDVTVGKEEHLLTNATTVSIEDAPELAERFNGVCYPAHIDRSSNGIIAILGTLPPTPHFSCVELRDGSTAQYYKDEYGIKNKTILVSSDAHRLTDMRDKEFFIDLDVSSNDGEEVRRALIAKLREKS